MIIRCPQCQFEREIPASAIPDGAVMATCPRCQTRFQFRNLERTEAQETSSPDVDSASVANAASMRKEEQAGNIASVGDDPLPPGAVVPTETRSASHLRTVHAGEPRGDQQDEKRVQNSVPDTSPEQGTSRSDSEAWTDLPWESPARYGQIGGLYHTILRVMFQAPRFFAVLPHCRGGKGRAIGFYLLLGMFQTLVKLFWIRNTAPAITDLQVQELLSASSMNMSLTLVIAPALLLVQLYIYTALFTLMLHLVQPTRIPFITVLRIVAYSAAPLVVSIVPILGPIVGSIWFSVCCFIGCRYALNLGWGKVALALVPLYMIAFAVFFQLVRQLAML